MVGPHLKVSLFPMAVGSKDLEVLSILSKKGALSLIGYEVVSLGAFDPPAMFKSIFRQTS